MPDSETRNWILRSLPADQRQAILARSEFVNLPKKRLLFDINQPITHAYFIEDGVASILSLLTDGTAVETLTCGREGMVGLPLYLGVDKASMQAFQQVPGSAWATPRDVFLEALEQSTELRHLLGRFTQASMTLMAQNSACNRRHSIEERCARWFLQTHDQMNGASYELTHQFLSQMLGVRRATVTVTAGGLQTAGLLTYHRGLVTVLNRPGLEEMVCECYAIIHNEYARLLGGDLLDDPISKMETSDGKISLVADGA